jgi:four helix bundle protein
MRMRRYEDLLLWQKAMQLAKMVYLLQKGLPKEEIYGLGDQIRRAVVSVPSNIAEGYGRGGDVEFKRFLAISRGSLFEVNR